MERILFLFIFVASTCGIVISGSLEILRRPSIESDVAIDIIKSCFANENRGIVLVRSFNEFDNRLLTDLQPVIIIQNDSSESFERTHKFQLFIVLEKFNVTENIQRLKKTRWWNHEGFFIILGDFEKREYCDSRAVGVLQSAWNEDILRGIYICTDPKNGPMIYTFNPFSKLAPKPWKKILNVPQLSGDPWTIHRQKLILTSIHCLSYDFDKIRYMKNYNGTNIIYNPFIYPFEDERKFIILLFKNLNANFKYKVVEDAHLNEQDNGDVQSPIGKMFSNKEVDTVLIITSLSYKKKIVQSSICMEARLIFLSFDRGPKSMLVQIFELFGWKLAVFTVFISTLTVFAFKFLLRKTIGVGTMEILRLWLNGGFMSDLTGNSLRIYLIGIFVYVQIIQAVVSGSILGFQLHPHHLKNINSVADLIEFEDYTIYGWPTFFKYIETENLENQHEAIDHPVNCAKYLLNNKKSVCLTPDAPVRDDIVKYNLYHSPTLSKIYFTFPMREDWPLSKRFNFIIRRIHESDLVPPIWRFFTIKKKDDSDEPPRNLNLDDFESPLKMLALGHVIAFICFVAELILHEIKMQVKRNLFRKQQANIERPINFYDLCSERESQT